VNGARPRTAVVVDGSRARRPPRPKLDYIHHRCFEEPDAHARFLAPMTPLIREAAPVPPTSSNPLGDAPRLRPEQEAYLFLRMNYLKYLASTLRAGPGRSRAQASVTAEIERLEAEAVAVRNQIIRSFLRLVVALARKRAMPGRDFLELVSEGNLSLLRAAECFDASRGIRFSTYATRAILNNFARSVARERKLRRRFVTDRRELYEEAADHRVDEQEFRGDADVMRCLLDRLSDHERGILIGRFGLGGDCGKTFRQLGHELGLSSVRVRQIETRARKRLRQFAQERGLDPAAAFQPSMRHVCNRQCVR
jgi:RNA polymerase primary sigma factor